MRLLRDEVYRLIAIAKGDVAATPDEQSKARADYRALLDALTRELQDQSSEVAITHESVRVTIEQAYRNSRNRKERAAAQRRLQSEGLQMLATFPDASRGRGVIITAGVWVKQERLPRFDRS